ncbi:MAG: hypothetical protein JXR86_11465 [Spirochaetales bacterium]|nr:hypothetical protein [Spirochaetales bacterium]
MRSIQLRILFISLLIPLYASPFLTDLLPDYRFDFSRLETEDPGWQIYSGINYTHFYENENGKFNDYQINTGILYQNELLSINALWKGSFLDGLLTVQGLDQVIDEGERDISSDRFYNGFQFDMTMKYLDLSVHSLGEQAFYDVSIQTPELYGFYLALNAERRPATFFHADLVKNYSFNGFLMGEGYSPRFGWRNDFIHADIAYVSSKYHFDPGPVEEKPLSIDLGCESLYGFAASLLIDTPVIDFEGTFRQSRYEISLSGRTESTGILSVESQNDPDGLINLIFREINSRFELLDGKLQIGGFFQSIHIPNENLNRGYVDMDPLSPVGVLYRRKDIVEDFGLFFQQAGGALGTTWDWGRYGISANVNLSYMSINTTGTYYYKDGLLNPIPLPHLTNVVIHDEQDMTDQIEYLLIEPEIAFNVSLGKLTLHTTMSQIFPVELNDEGNISGEPGSSGDSELFSTTGGFRASLLLSFSF